MKPANKSLLVKLVGAATLLGVLIIITRSTGPAEYLNPGELGDLEDWIEGLGPAAPLIFIAVYAAAAVAFLPGTPLTLIAGLAFGPFWRTLWALTGATAGATLAFLSGRYIARDAVESWAEGSECLRRLDEKVERQGWRILVVTRLVPLFPFNLQSCVYGVTRIKPDTLCSGLRNLHGAGGGDLRFRGWLPDERRHNESLCIPGDSGGVLRARLYDLHPAQKEVLDRKED